MDNKKIGIILTVVGFILVVIGIINLIPKKETYVEKVNAELNNEQILFLVKEMEKNLPESEDINSSTSYTVDEMISYAFSYTAYLDTQSASIDEEKDLGIANIEVIKEKVNYLFAVDNLDLTTSTYEIKEGNIYVPLNLQGGDAQIYKYKNTEYNEVTGEYIAKIDCLEVASPDDASTLLEKTEYNEENVIYTLQIKYKVVDGRRILLAYNTL